MKINMAAAFGHESNECRECGEQSSPPARYTVTEKQALCDECAKRKEQNIDPDANQTVWKCSVHPMEEVKVIDTTCEYLGMCHTCALTVHAGHTFKDVNKFESYLRRLARNRRSRLSDVKKRHEDIYKTVMNTQKTTNRCLASVQSQVTNAVDENISIVRGKQRQMNDVIRERAEEEIRRIRMQMENEIRENEEKADEKVSRMKSRHCELIEKCEAEKKSWNEEVQKHREGLETIRDDVKTVNVLLDADAQSLIGRTKDLKLFCEKDLPKELSMKAAKKWEFKRYCTGDVQVGEIRSYSKFFTSSFWRRKKNAGTKMDDGKNN